MADPTTTYCSLSDLKLMFGEREVVAFADKDGEGVEDSASVTLVINMVSSEIESYLRQRYTLPLDSVPYVLKRIACQMVRYYFYGDAMTKLVRQNYEDAIAFLKELASGAKTLGDDFESSEVSGVQYSGNDRVLSRDNLDVM